MRKVLKPIGLNRFLGSRDTGYRGEGPYFASIIVLSPRSETMTFSKNNKMLSHIGYRMKVTMQDSRTFIGIFKDLREGAFVAMEMKRLMIHPGL
ncbi:putative small nuclear ribonucleoprotein-associated protein B [Portunus trituberculatus]|uniref:Putative small nuclear ribonucleoprotein-associated protein B n=1 Tax=Portunus trituberculatus TaxID=210409 RepID=A0A5B7D2L5_PORTR|nr:putative small nuclear ribonucleoprotein-associated protein B [Portunus trituberculatus]